MENFIAVYDTIDEVSYLFYLDGNFMYKAKLNNSFEELCLLVRKYGDNVSEYPTIEVDKYSNFNDIFKDITGFIIDKNYLLTDMKGNQFFRTSKDLLILPNNTALHNDITEFIIHADHRLGEKDETLTIINNYKISFITERYGIFINTIKDNLILVA